jgi:hypothetical protein
LKIISTIRAQLEDKEFTVLKTRIIFLLVEWHKAFYSTKTKKNKSYYGGMYIDFISSGSNNTILTIHDIEECLNCWF